MTDFAALGIRVDTSQAKAAFTDLDKLAEAGGRAEKAVDGLANASGKSKKELAAAAREASAAARSIDDYVKKLQISATTNGMGAREAKLYELAVNGASKAQLQAADSAIRMNEGYEKGVAIGQRIRASFIAVAAAATASAVAVYAGTISLIEQVASYKDIAEKIGDTARNVSSLKEASDVSGVSINTVAEASARLTASLSKTDDESKLVVKGLQAIGISLADFKKQSPVEQLESIARGLAEYRDGAEKTAVSQAILGRQGSELLKFFNEYAEKGREAAFVTDELGDAADAYADAQARLKSQIEQFLQVSAAQAVPILTDIAELFKSVAGAQGDTTVASELVKTAMDGVVVVFQTIAIVATDVIFVFKGVGREIGAIAAQLVALATLDFSGFRAISDAVTDDAKRARSELDALQARILSIGQQKAGHDKSGNFDDSDARTSSKPRIDVTGLNTDRTKKAKKDTSAAQEAKKQLDADLAAIKNAQDATIATYANAEKILQAMRSASLVDVGTYYAEKKRLMDLSAAAQEAGLREEIARLEKEKLTGKDAIENDKKIADAKAKLAKAQATASTASTILLIEQKDALDDIQRAYDDARDAAQSYLDVADKARQREIDGMGQGAKRRDFDAGLSQIEDRYEQQRQALQRDKRNGKFTGREQDYARELALLNEFQDKSIASYTRGFSEIEKRQASFALGASEALKNYYDESQNVFKQAEDAVTSAFKGMEDALVSFVKTGKLDFKSLADSIISDIARIVIKQQITGPLAGLIGGLFSKNWSSGLTAAGTSDLTSITGRAIGGPVSAGNLYRINEKGVGETFETAGRQYFMPATDGTVKTGGGSGGGTQINHFTVGDVPTVSTVRQAINQAQAQASAALRRSRNYGGEAQ